MVLSVIVLMGLILEWTVAGAQLCRELGNTAWRDGSFTDRGQTVRELYCTAGTFIAGL